MPDFPDHVDFPPLFLGTMTQPYCGMEARAIAGLSPASGAWPAVSYIAYVPFWIPFSYPIRRLWWVNGSTAGGNTDVGIYSVDGARMLSTGSTAGSGNGIPQYVAMDMLLAPGSYYFAMTHDTTTVNQINRSTALTVIQQRMIGHLGQASTIPLPATATFAASSQIVYPICGMTLTSSGF
jgi:hypothetical protein